MPEINFEDAVKRIEEIVSILEQGTAPLDKSLELFEEGNRLIKLCNQQLVSAEQKLRILASSDNENPSQPYEVEQ